VGGKRYGGVAIHLLVVGQKTQKEHGLGRVGREESEEWGLPIVILYLGRLQDNEGKTIC